MPLQCRCCDAARDAHAKGKNEHTIASPLLLLYSLLLEFVISLQHTVVESWALAVPEY